MIKIEKETSTFKIYDEIGFKILASYDFKRKKMDVTSETGKNFCFLPSTPDTVKRIGALIHEAGKYAEILAMAEVDQ